MNGMTYIICIDRMCATYRFGVVRGERPGPEHCYLHGRGAENSIALWY